MNWILRITIFLKINKFKFLNLILIARGKMSYSFKSMTEVRGDSNPYYKTRTEVMKDYLDNKVGFKNAI